MNTFKIAPRQTLLRLWTPCIAMMLLSLLSYVDRSVLAILSPTILADLHLNATQYGYAVLAFSLCYMVANPIWGIWIGRRGLALTVLVAVSVWSLASAGHALMLGLTGMCFARALLGFGEGATFPAALATVAETLPVERRSFGLALAFSGGSLGATLTPILITPLALRHGWRSTFLLTGLLGLLWIFLWLTLRSSGLYRPIAPIHIKSTSSPPNSLSRWNRNLIATALLYGLGAAPFAFGIYAAPLYLSRVLHVSQASLGHLLWIPPAGWEVGYLVWGRIADRRRSNSPDHSIRPTSILIALSIAGFAIVLAPLAVSSPYPVASTMSLFFLQMFLGGGFVVLSLSDGMDFQQPQTAGFLSGVSISFWALFTGLLTPVLGHFFDRGQYTRGCWVVAALPLLGTVLWLYLRSSRFSVKVGQPG